MALEIVTTLFLFSREEKKSLDIRPSLEQELRLGVNQLTPFCGWCVCTASALLPVNYLYSGRISKTSCWSCQNNTFYNLPVN